MFNQNLLFQARWDELYNFFADGYPPLIVKLLVINTIFLMFYVFRRATAKHRLRPTTAYAVQGLLIATNALAMFQNDVLGLATGARSFVNF